ncbi:MAG: AEC family transporter [Acetobacteraceae bacterium]
MSNLVLLFVSLCAGIVLGQRQWLPPNTPNVLNGIVLFVSLPALILLQVHGIHPKMELIYPVSMPWLLFILGCCFFWLLGRALRLPRTTTGGLMLVGGLANTSFVGLPMIEAFYGRGGMATGILIDQLGTYMVLSTLGILVATMYSQRATDTRPFWYRIVRFPPFLVLILALVLVGVDYPAVVTDVLRSLAGTLTPLALISVGMQLRLDVLSGNLAALAGGLAFKLLIAPALLGLLYVGWLHAHGEAIRITLFESAMGPMIGGAIVAMQNDLNPPLITLMVGLGITLSFLTLPGWWYLLGAV